MTALVEPTFDDVVFDPACGTGGFLFDVYEFVMQRYLKDNKWPGEKAHTETREWFKQYFEKNPLDMPSDAQARQFYRSGVDNNIMSKVKSILDKYSNLLKEAETKEHKSMRLLLHNYAIEK